ncbi:hypothetical protein Rsub_09981 [Raphidocelis subcapitata]|uniref:Kazal-like domain-containing protein n=1 Tax=Raphidocelis subcapitata TaxID=307507 RepID=A0A2V0PH90_9CHLO|nr:hypothetical protein Rsub_09981 [Raphidocelis subcapitata]|eukprot:GBF97290.1 hypothetical protein Rsub_09981 [Raphidocelis subcapitata]
MGSRRRRRGQTLGALWLGTVLGPVLFAAGATAGDVPAGSAAAYRRMLSFKQQRQQPPQPPPQLAVLTIAPRAPEPAFAAATLAAAAAPPQPPVPSPCGCRTVLRPVCAAPAAGGPPATFSSRCTAACAKAVVQAEGPCPDPPALPPPTAVPDSLYGGPLDDPSDAPSVLPPRCPCPAVADPVCAYAPTIGERRQFRSLCDARCTGAQDIKPGLCTATGPAAPPPAAGAARRRCTCPMDVDPVCGANGVSYDNPCGAACASVHTWVRGRCAADGSAVEAPALPAVTTATSTAKPAAAAAAAAAGSPPVSAAAAAAP